MLSPPHQAQTFHPLQGETHTQADSTVTAAVVLKIEPTHNGQEILVATIFGQL